MIIRELAKLPFFTAGDGTWLCEMLNAKEANANIPYSLAYAEMIPFQISKRHRLLKGTEVHIVLEGTASFHIEGEDKMVSPISAVVVPPGKWQYIANGPERLRILCIVSPAWHKEDEEVEERT
jgi:mannose-6-phosphate isomerase-like protein (cupin superfamily)